jgi:large-conductance mechanosensitive channel
MTGFKNFVMRGNLVELAVAVVIGTQFSSLVKQFVSSFIDPRAPTGSALKLDIHCVRTYWIRGFTAFCRQEARTDAPPVTVCLA